MNPVEFKDQTMVFRKPSNMTDEQCTSLPAKQHIIDIEGDKFNAIESVWELSPQERKEVNESGRIRLRVIASGMPPVSLIVEPKEVIKEEAPKVDPNEMYCASSMVKRIKHIEEIKVLEVEFNNGKTYHYKDFPAILWNDLKEAKSIGQFINKNIKGQFVEVEIIAE